MAASEAKGGMYQMRLVSSSHACPATLAWGPRTDSARAGDVRADHRRLFRPRRHVRQAGTLLFLLLRCPLLTSWVVLPGLADRSA
eukprot:1720025-Rhodomonas_salina.2